jgi:hypothetical protein
MQRLSTKNTKVTNKTRIKMKGSARLMFRKKLI